MASRRASIQESSLDLLLDTITNAFGGILLIAILVVALLQTRGRSIDPPAEDTASQMTDMAAQLQRLEEEIAPVKLEIEALDAISSRLSNPELRSTLNSLKAQRQHRDELAAEKVKLLQLIARAQNELGSVLERDSSLTDDTALETAKLDAHRGNLEEERAKRKINSPFPEERPASKSSNSVTIKYGRWYVERSSLGEPNLHDFAVLDNSGKYLTITPKPYRGKPVKVNGRLSSEIIRELEGKDPQQDYIDISIWDDSYEQFQLLRDYLVEKGFEYRLIIVTDGDEVVEGFVPDPQVQ